MDIFTMDQKPICINGLAMRWWNVKFQVSINTAAWWELGGWDGWGLLQRRGGVGGESRASISFMGCRMSDVSVSVFLFVTLLKG